MFPHFRGILAPGPEKLAEFLGYATNIGEICGLEAQLSVGSGRRGLAALARSETDRVPGRLVYPGVARQSLPLAPGTPDGRALTDDAPPQGRTATNARFPRPVVGHQAGLVAAGSAIGPYVVPKRGAAGPD